MRPFHNVTRTGRSHGVLVNATRRPKDSAPTTKPQNLSDEDEADEDLYEEVRRFNPHRPERRSRRNHLETLEERKRDRRKLQFAQLEPPSREKSQGDGVEQKKSSPRRSPSRHEAPQDTTHHLEGHHFGRLKRTYSDVNPEERAARHRALHERAEAEREKREEAEKDGWTVPEKGDWI